ncbi:two-component system, NarL family, sensor histidine kinase ComP [Anaerolineae bacterium]|nr:two-component system, NarL family, sensor histidine kinase ComP [Anaerolineae bacterium]
MIPAKRPLLLTFGTALGLSALALILTLATPLGATSSLFLFIVAIMLSARLGGWGPGLFAALFATAASMYFFLPTIGVFGIASFGLLALFIVALVSRDFTARKTSAEDVARLVAIVNSSEDAIVTKTLDGTIQTWNPSADRLFGYAADETIGKSIQIIYPPERLDEFEKIRARLKRGESTEQFDTVRLAKDGRQIDVSISETLMRDAPGNVIGVSKVIRDITPRKHAEATARFLAQVNDVLASSLDYETTLASIARLAVPHIADWCAVYITLEDGTIQQLALEHVDPTKVERAHELQHRYLDNPHAPYSVPNVIQTGKPELAPPFTDEQGASARDDAALEISPDPGLKSLMVVPLIAPGRTFGAITFVSAESGRYYGQADLALAQDLARRAALAVDNARLYHTAKSLNQELDQRVARRTRELSEANQQLRLLAAHLQSAREEERIKIARSIHDELGTLMTAIKMDLAFLVRENGTPKSPGAMREEISATTKLVDEAIESVHHIARELRPGVLDHLGLRAALEWQMQEFQERAKIECQFNSDLDEFNLDPARSTAVFRIMQETLTNVARHAHATRVEISLRKEENDLILEVRDNGKGISETPDTNRFGILGMRERAHVFGGDVMIQGAPGQGTVVTVRIPV